MKNHKKRGHASRVKYAEIAGWYGAVACLFAYASVSYGFMQADSLAFQLLNISSAISVVWLSYEKRIMQTMVLNIVWAGIGMVALVKILSH